MIGRLTGVVVEKALDGSCVLDVQGVGYEVVVPLRSLHRLPAPPESITLQVHTHVREDIFKLYGFEGAFDRAAFRALIGTTGVGPKLAMALLSDMPAAELSLAIARGDKKRLGAVSGIGKKMAERLVLELKDKLPAISLTESEAGLRSAPTAVLGRAGEVAAALTALGFSRAQAEAAASTVVQKDDARPIEALIRQALSGLA